MIASRKNALLSELAQTHFREKSNVTYEDLIHAIEQEGYSNPSEKFEMLRRVFEPSVDAARRSDSIDSKLSEAR